MKQHETTTTMITTTNTTTANTIAFINITNTTSNKKITCLRIGKSPLVTSPRVVSEVAIWEARETEDDRTNSIDMLLLLLLFLMEECLRRIPERLRKCHLFLCRKENPSHDFLCSAINQSLYGFHEHFCAFIICENYWMRGRILEIRWDYHQVPLSWPPLCWGLGGVMWCRANGKVNKSCASCLL